MARCPHGHCGKKISRDETGEYPAHCPHCGLLVKSKRSAKVASAPASDPPHLVREDDDGDDAPFTPQPAKPAGKERTVRSFTESADDDPFGVRAPRGASSSNPFTPSAAPKSAERGNVLPFGDFPSAPTRAPVTVPPADYTLPIVFTLLLLAGGGVGAFVYWKQQQPGGALATTPVDSALTITSNVCSFDLPSTLWARDAPRERDANVNMVLHRSDKGGWIVLASKQLAATARATPVQLADELLAQWPEQYEDYEEISVGSDVVLGGQPARKVEAEGTRDGVRLKLIGIAGVMGGAACQLTFEAPKGDFKSLEDDFAILTKSFRFLDTDNATQAAESTVAIASKKLPYELRLPPRWVEYADLPTDSRFADLKIIERRKDGQIVVTPRETADMGRFSDLYVERQRKLHENGRVMVRPAENLTVNGMPARRLRVMIEDGDTKLLRVATFIQHEKHVYQIECQAPADLAAEYDPVFIEAAASFRILPEIAGITKDEKSAKDGDEPTETAAAKPAKAAPKGEMSDDDDKPAKTLASKTPPKTTPGKRASLDDLDGDMPAEKATATKPTAAKSTAKAAASKTGRPSLDDLDGDMPASKPAAAKPGAKPSDTSDDDEMEKPAEKPVAKRIKFLDGPDGKVGANDDMPADEPEMKGEAAKKPAEAKKEAAKPGEKTDAKKRKSLDDLD